MGRANARGQDLRTVVGGAPISRLQPHAKEISEMTIQVGDRLPDVPADHRHRRRPAADHQRRLFRRQARRPVRGARRVHADLLGAPPAVLCRQGRRAERQGHRRDRLHLGQRSVRHGAPGTSATARDDITMLADGNGEFAEALGLDDGRQQVRHGQALAALFDDRQRRRRRAAQRRGAGRISRVQRRDCSTSSPPPDPPQRWLAVLFAARSKRSAVPRVDRLV